MVSCQESDRIMQTRLSNVEKKNLLLCCSGNVTTKQIKGLLNSLQKLNSHVDDFHLRVVVTDDSCTAFIDDSINQLVEKIYSDQDEWSLWRAKGDPVLHIDLTKWADVLVLAPLDFNTLTKIASGICDNLLTCTLRAWNLKKPVIFCPAIAFEVSKNQLIQKHITTLQSWGYKGLFPTASMPSRMWCDGYPMVDPMEITNMVVHILTTGKG